MTGFGNILVKILGRWAFYVTGKIFQTLQLCIFPCILQRHIIYGEGHILNGRLFPEPIYSLSFLSLPKGNYSNYFAGKLILKEIFILPLIIFSRKKQRQLVSSASIFPFTPWNQQHNKGLCQSGVWNCC